jgi:hypothetical protein
LLYLLFKYIERRMSLSPPFFTAYLRADWLHQIFTTVAMMDFGSIYVVGSDQDKCKNRGAKEIYRGMPKLAL